MAAHWHGTGVALAARLGAWGRSRRLSSQFQCMHPLFRTLHAPPCHTANRTCSGPMLLVTTHVHARTDMTLFNVIFSALTPFVIGVFDRDVDKQAGKDNPKLYLQGGLRGGWGRGDVQ